jgi:adenosylmethionine-8-amino-7-oxononanoate aminotransferase
LRPIGKTVYLMPPYILSDDELALLAERMRIVFDATLSEAA